MGPAVGGPARLARVLTSVAMRVVNMREAKTHLSRLVQAAAQGEPFIIARAGTSMVKVVAVDAPEPGEMRSTGFLSGVVSSPDDFDGMGCSEIERMFEGDA